MPVTAKLSRCFYDQLGGDFAFRTATIIPLAALILALDRAFQR